MDAELKASLKKNWYLGAICLGLVGTGLYMGMHQPAPRADAVAPRAMAGDPSARAVNSNLGRAI